MYPRILAMSYPCPVSVSMLLKSTLIEFKLLIRLKQIDYAIRHAKQTKKDGVVEKSIASFYRGSAKNSRPSLEAQCPVCHP